jgi:ribonucleoside-triphosphate reductase
MANLKMKPSRDAGRFAYHLKFLLKADLVETIVDQKKYCLTDLGKMVIEVADRIDRKAYRPKRILVRASRLAIEEFDANRIANTLLKEAKMPVEQAQKIAKEAETQLLKAKTKYLTAPLVREVVNAILIEKGLEEYRHKLTRLGIPVHDVTTLLHSQKPKDPLLSAGETVFKEYTLLNAMPRDIADAHLSGDIHIDELSTWLLKPAEIFHDIRFFLRHGLSLESLNPSQANLSRATNIENALGIISKTLLFSGRETSGTQTIPYFNVFLAPYVENAESERNKQTLNTFITDVCHFADTALSLELTVPSFLAHETAGGPAGKQSREYKDYTQESQGLAAIVLEAFVSQSQEKSLTNPKLLINIRPETFKDERAKLLLLEAHDLAAKNNGVYFANHTQKNQAQTVYSSSGFRITPEDDWEIETLRTGCLGIVTIDLPRIVIESEKDSARFSQGLKDKLELANRALEIKREIISHNFKNLLPFLAQYGNGDRYYRFENAYAIINLTGLKEAAEAFTEKPHDSPEAQNFQINLLQNINNPVSKTGRRRTKYTRHLVLPNIEAATRLAQLDIERYGIARVPHSGSRDKPHYSTTTRLQMQTLGVQQTEQNLSAELQTGIDLTTIELDEVDHNAKQLLEITEKLILNQKTELFTYTKKTTYCLNCKKTWNGIKTKCPECNAMSTLTIFARFDES